MYLYVFLWKMLIFFFWMYLEKIFLCFLFPRNTKTFSVPFGFALFAETFNAVLEHQYCYHFATLDKDMGQWKVPEEWVWSHHIHTYFVDREHYHDLIMMGLLTDYGNIDPTAFKITMAALQKPHRDSFFKSCHYCICCDTCDDMAHSDGKDSESDSDDSDSELEYGQFPYREDQDPASNRGWSALSIHSYSPLLALLSFLSSSQQMQPFSCIYYDTWSPRKSSFMLSWQDYCGKLVHA